MKRWNRKGSHHAKVRMAELRERHAHQRLVALIAEWAATTGRPFADWWPHCQASFIGPAIGGGPRPVTTQGKIACIKRDIAAARAAAKGQAVGNNS